MRCDVHALLNISEADEPALDVRACNLCGKNMCAACRKSPTRRAKAFGKTFARMFGKAA